MTAQGQERPVPSADEILAFEEAWWRENASRATAAWDGGLGGRKQQHIRDRWGLSDIRYLQLLNAAMHDEVAVAVYPRTVLRLRSARDRHMRGRGGRRGTRSA